MKKAIVVTGLILIFNIAHAQKIELTPDDFGIKASVHVKKLCEFGERSSGSEAEKKTIDYLIKELKLSGMNLFIDTLKYRFYHLNNRASYINNCKIPIKVAYINNPISDTIKFESDCIKLTDNYKVDDLHNKVVLTSTSLNSIILEKYEPKAILVLDPNIFDTLKIAETEKSTISFYGHLESEWIKSYNVIASYKHEFPVDSTIAITAHWDSSNGVGAGDNASGTAALIELAKFFSKRLSYLKYNLLFIATGAEEPGLVGSMSYVLNHSEDLDKCLFNMNIDDISGLKSYIEKSNPGLPRTRSDTSQTLTVISHYKSKGNLITSFMEVWGNNHENIYPVSWLRNKFEKSMTDLGFDFQDAGCCSGVDSRAFDYMGIPYISMTTINSDTNDDNANTPNDVYNDSFIKNINMNGKIASKILLDINK